MPELDYKLAWNCLLKFCLYGSIERFEQEGMEEQGEILFGIVKIMKHMESQGVDPSRFTPEIIKEQFNAEPTPPLFKNCAV